MTMNATTKQFSRSFRALSVSLCAACAILAAPAHGQDEGVNVSDTGTVDIAVQDTDLAQVLQMLSIQTKKNIIASKNVSGTVTANLYNVTFKEALDNILKVNGFTYIEEGNFIYVYTQSEYEEIMEAQRKTESRIFELDYLSAADAQQFVTPLLSTSGQVSAVGTVPVGFQPDIADGGADDYAFTAKIVVNDYPEVLDGIDSLLNDLDTPPQQVLVESAILQTRLDETNAFGIDFSVIGGFDFADLMEPLSAVDELIDGTFSPSPLDYAVGGSQTSVGNTGGPGGMKIGVVSNDISVFMRLLDEVTDTTVLSRPKVLALNRQRAAVLVGRRVGYLSTTATETTTTQTVEFLDTGVQLIFRPFISKDGSIRMELAPSVSEANLRQVSDQGGNLVTIPDEDTNEITTNVRVQDGKTIVLGGLFRESTSITKRNVPFFGDIPLVGAAFQGHDNDVERTEITFLITPNIVKDAQLERIGEDLVLNIERARVGIRRGLLPFSREFITSNYNMDAIDAFNNGETELALHYIDSSLNTHPNQPDVLQLKEQVTGASVRAYERSVMERVIRKEMGSLMEATGHAAPFSTGAKLDRSEPATYGSFSQAFDTIFENNFRSEGQRYRPVANAPTGRP